jgi:hypothetical protein
VLNTAMPSGAPMTRPTIALPKESDMRKDFFERDQEGPRPHLPPSCSAAI